MMKKKSEVKRIKLKVHTETKRITAPFRVIEQPETKPRSIKVKVTSEVKPITRPKFDFDE